MTSSGRISLTPGHNQFSRRSISYEQASARANEDLLDRPDISRIGCLGSVRRTSRLLVRPKHVIWVAVGTEAKSLKTNTCLSC
jgi:hypothetical protein